MRADSNSAALSHCSHPLHGYAVYLVADRAYAASMGRRLESVVERALASKCVSAVQLRDKQLGTRDAIRLAERLRDACHAARVPFLINDRLDVALAVDADGLHVGQDDMPAELARHLLPAGKLLGVSAGDEHEAVADGALAAADYFGVGSVYGTASKVDAGAPIGVDGLRLVARRVAPTPVVAIGGIGVGEAEEEEKRRDDTACSPATACVRDGGAAGVAVISAIIGADDPAAAARALYAQVKRARAAAATAAAASARRVHDQRE